jgi:hypothetical protein
MRSESLKVVAVGEALTATVTAVDKGFGSMRFVGKDDGTFQQVLHSRKLPGQSWLDFKTSSGDAKACEG